MICYKDKTFCINEECKHYKKCDRNYEKAKLERDCHFDIEKYLDIVDWLNVPNVNYG